MLSSSTDPDYSELPDGIVLSISAKLETRNDTLRFRFVCKRFQSLVPPPPDRALPSEAIQIPYPIAPFTDPLAHYLLLESKIYAIQSLDKVSNPLCWIVKVQELGGGRARLKDPLSGSVYGGLAECFPEPLNLLNYEVTEITKAYDLLLVLSDELDMMDEVNLVLPFVVEKIVVSNDHDIMAMHSGGKLIIWRKGDSCWRELNININEVQFEDVIYYDNKFYAVDNHGRTISVDCKTLETSQFVNPLPRLSAGQFKYLVRTEDCFYLIVQFQIDVEDGDFWNEYFYPLQFVVFRRDEDTREWIEKMDGFEDRVFCLGNACSYSFLASEFPGTIGNSIYYNDSLFGQVGGDRPGSEAGIYDLTNHNARPISDFPGYSGLFWPPPNWLW
ncbi:F-box protein SKIP23-like [Melia azedarach]|uniref:F-box protein SKIP23-like n=1 Tax=Melia azedarach TaxID=155640 RepID=A0ACC1XTF0_MELAZ|nr:F-box protein SKIP23-like [Melia azedarach]